MINSSDLLENQPCNTISYLNIEELFLVLLQETITQKVKAMLGFESFESDVKILLI